MHSNIVQSFKIKDVTYSSGGGFALIPEGPKDEDVPFDAEYSESHKEETALPTAQDEIVCYKAQIALLQNALVSAKAAIKGMEHTGLIDKALAATGFTEKTA